MRSKSTNTGNGSYTLMTVYLPQRAATCLRRLATRMIMVTSFQKLTIVVLLLISYISVRNFRSFVNLIME